DYRPSRRILPQLSARHAHGHLDFDLEVGPCQCGDADTSKTRLLTVEQRMYMWPQLAEPGLVEVDKIDAHDHQIFRGGTDGVERGFGVANDELRLPSQRRRDGTAVIGPSHLPRNTGNPTCFGNRDLRI